MQGHTSTGCVGSVDRAGDHVSIVVRFDLPGFGREPVAHDLDPPRSGRDLFGRRSGEIGWLGRKDPIRDVPAGRREEATGRGETRSLLSNGRHADAPGIPEVRDAGAEVVEHVLADGLVGAGRQVSIGKVERRVCVRVDEARGCEPAEQRIRVIVRRERDAPVDHPKLDVRRDDVVAHCDDCTGVLAKICGEIFFTLFCLVFHSPALLQNDQVFSHS